jgi:hypothetical protein
MSCGLDVESEVVFRDGQKQKENMKIRKLQLAIMAASLAVAMSANAAMLVDRGLPTANLNNAAGPNRANVDWLQIGSSAGYYVVGDTFKNTSSQTWSINTIRLWTDGGTDQAILWGGVQGSTIGVVQGSGVISGPTTYVNGYGYQANSGLYYDLHQIDFAVNIILAPGQTYDFFLDGTDPTSGYTLPFVEASNAALSGSPQDGADNTMLQAEVVNGILGNVVTWTSLNNGWDKASDVNVQVIGTPVPEPTTMIAGALLLLPFGASTLRMLRKRQTA